MSASQHVPIAGQTDANLLRESSWPPVREGEEPWTTEELDELRAELESDRDRLKAELAESEALREARAARNTVAELEEDVRSAREAYEAL